jgi:uncharacterized protein YukE
MTVLLDRGRSALFVSSGFGFEPRVINHSNGTKIYSGVPVFRSGTFRDSVGEQNTWEKLHLNQMMDNYSHLVNNKVLTSVPVRDGHKSWISKNTPGNGKVVGWHSDIAVKDMKSPLDSKTYTYLLTDYALTEPYAQQAAENGTFRNRSAEIGTYVTNQESEHWPVYLGFAFVDFPAVEGLNFSQYQGDGPKFYAWVSWDNQGATVDPTQTGGNGLPFPTNMLPGGQPAGASSNSSFTIGGQQVTDPAQVQAYITRLETFETETRQAARSAFVAGLVASNRVPVTQKDEMIQFANGLTADQYGQWMAQWNGVEALSVLSQHASGTTNHTNASEANVDQGIADAEAMVKMHQLAGMSPDVIKLTGSYKKLVAAGKREA